MRYKKSDNHCLQLKANKHGNPTCCPMDLFFLDLNVPDMNGFEFLNGLGKTNEIDRSRLTTIFLISSTNKKDAEKAVSYNGMAFGYLTKP